jgi:hypothetical protein
LTDIVAKILMEIGITSDPTPGIVEIYRLKTKQRTIGMPPVIIAKMVSSLWLTFFSIKKESPSNRKILVKYAEIFIHQRTTDKGVPTFVEKS